MRFFWLLLIWFCAATPLAAQSGDDSERGVLEAFLEDNLSAAGRSVNIVGFAGALSSQATMQELTIADDEGVWLTLRGVVLNWSRSALLGGRLEVKELSAKEILLPRLPQTGQKTPDVAAEPFQLPDLPVSVNIGSISAEKVEIGETVVGEAAVVSLLGSLSLDGGQGAAELKITRTDDIGEFSLNASFANAAEELSIDLQLSEGPDGIVANLAALPGRPALALTVKGEGPLSDFGADIGLRSDGQDRLTGRVTLTAEADDAGAVSRRFGGDLSGDIAPLFAPDLRPFFGPEIRLSFAGNRSPEGQIEISDLMLSAASVNLRGRVVLAADGMPQSFDLTAGVNANGAPVLLPISRPDTKVTNARLTADFDAAQGDVWRLRAQLDDFSRDGLTLATAALDGTGTIRAQPDQRVTAVFDFDVTGLDHDNTALATALGPALGGNVDLVWASGNPIEVASLSAQGAGLILRGKGRLDGLAEGFPVSGSAHVETDDIARFAALANRPLGGAAAIDLTGQGALLGGAFDIALEASTVDLQTGTPRVDPLLKGQSHLSLVALRDQGGTKVEKFLLQGETLTAKANGALTEEAGKLILSGQLDDIALVEPRLSGPVTLDADVGWIKDQPVTLSRLILTAVGATIQASGTLDIADDTLPATGQLNLKAPDLAPFSRIAGRPLHGAIEGSFQGQATLAANDFDITLDATGQNLGAGLGELDKLISGKSILSGRVNRTGDLLSLTGLKIETPQIRASADGDAKSGLAFDARLADLGLLVPEFPGPLTAKGRVQQSGDEWTIAVDADGAGGTTAQVSGQIDPVQNRAKLTLKGDAPLGLANPFIAPRSVQGRLTYDLALNGKLGLPALSGTLSTTGARAALPTIGAAIETIDSTVTLNAAQASVRLTGQVRGGGQITALGPIGLTAPYRSDLKINLDQIALSDPELFKTDVSGPLTLTGPIASGARLRGRLVLGVTEIQVPSSGLGGTVAIPEIKHVNEPARVHATRQRAGLLKTTDESGGPAGAGIGLDLRINAPNRIFVRGRGLDAELGGELRVGGTSTAVVPSGRFGLIRGRLDLLGKRLTMTEGAISLQGALEPYIRLVAESTADDVLVQIVTEGPASDPEITFQSQPELPQEEVVARLIFGRSTENLSPFQAAQLASAVASLAGNDKVGIVDRLRKNFGLDDLDVTTDDLGSTELRAGKYLSENIYTDVTINSDGKSNVNLNLDVSRNVTVKGGVSAVGDTSLGVFYERDY